MRENFLVEYTLCMTDFEIYDMHHTPQMPGYHKMNISKVFREYWSVSVHR